MILLIKCMVQTVPVLVHPVLLSLSRGKRLYVCMHKGLGPLFTFFKNAAPKTNIRIYAMNTPSF